MEAGDVEEEMMALESIFYDCFTKLEGNRFRVRIDASTEAPPFFLETSLPPSYPQEAPIFDVSNINNNPYTDFSKKAVVDGLQEQASALIGESMCYTLLEWLKDKLPEFYLMRSNAAEEGNADLISGSSPNASHKEPDSIKKDGKSKMTKAQKRRYFDRFGAAAEKPRGWDWVSIISHLSQVPQHGAL